MNLAALFYPKSIAVIGASSEEKAVGNDIAENLVKQGFEGQVYLINPKIQELHGVRTYPSIEVVPGDVDLVVLVIPAAAISTELKKAARKKVKAAIVISAGFKESGNQALEDELIATCRSLDITLVGPNCLGIINPEIKMNASFAKLMPPAGSVAFISQSGALCTAILDYAIDLGIGFSKFLSIGNKALLKELELIEYLYHDPKTQVICVYAESLADAPAYIAKLRELRSTGVQKPILILKSGKTQAGMRAVASHTGSLSTTDSSYEALFAQSGMIRVATIAELFDLIQVFTTTNIQVVTRVAIVTNAGGPGVLATDVLVESGLQLAEISENTKQALQSVLSKSASIKNPIDILGDASGERYAKALALVVADEGVDALVVLLTPQSMTEPEKTAQSIVALREKTNKPIVVSFMGQELVALGKKILREGDIPTLQFPESAAHALGQFAAFNRFLDQSSHTPFKFTGLDPERVRVLFEQAREAGNYKFPEAYALEIMRAYGLPVVRTAIVKTSDELVQASETFTENVALKIISSDILHKSDVGGVRLHVTAKDILTESKALLDHIKQMQPEARIEGLLLMEMVELGRELIVGIVKNSLGTLIMCGLGGIYVEVFKDVSFAFAPVNQEDAWRMVRSLRSHPLLAGTRGQKGVDEAAIVDVIGRLSQLAVDFPEIVELDINPLSVTPAGAKVLDARLVIAKD